MTESAEKNFPAYSHLPWDNSPMEHFFRSLKYEWISVAGYVRLNEDAYVITVY